MDDDGDSRPTMDTPNSLEEEEETGENFRSSAAPEAQVENSESMKPATCLEEGEDCENSGSCEGTNGGDQSDSNDGDCKDVPCDSCIENPSQAVKSCLTCLVSYCEAHLRPHLESRRFQSHRLVAPQMELEERCCVEHRLPLELFCSEDTCATCLCNTCWEQRHLDHHTLPMAEARRLAQAELQRKKREITRTVSAAEDAITSLQNNSASVERSVLSLQRTLEQQFSKVQVAVERAREEVRGALEGELKRVARQAEGIQAHLHLKICQLRKCLVSGERFSNNKNDVDFMQDYYEWMRASVDIHLPEVSINLPERLNKFKHSLSDTTQELCEHLLTSYRRQLTQLCPREGSNINTTIQSTPSDLNASEPEPVMRSDLLSYATSLTINTDSVHQFLWLTEGNKRLTNTTPWRHGYPQHSERFQHWRQALANESLFLGRHYFEVELSGRGAHVGLTYHSIQRKSAEPSGCITGNTFSWSLRRSSHGLSCWHAGQEISLEGEPLSQVGVYVDYQAGVIAFYGVAGAWTLLHKYRSQFLEPLYPAFWLSKKDDTICLLNIAEH